MKRVLFTGFALLLASTTVVAQGVNVDGYARRDGSYVAPHHRSGPDNSYNNNWSVSPNSNPYTGQRGHERPTFNDRPPPSNNTFGGSNTYGGQRRW